jgi:hypothetical protein
MKSVEISTDTDKLRVTKFAERMRDLVIEARSQGVQLSMPVIEDKPELKKKTSQFQHYKVSVEIPQYFGHHFLGEPTYVTASAVLDDRPRSSAHDSRIVPPFDRILDSAHPIT